MVEDVYECALVGLLFKVRNILREIYIQSDSCFILSCERRRSGKQPKVQLQRIGLESQRELCLSYSSLHLNFLCKIRHRLRCFPVCLCLRHESHLAQRGFARLGFPGTMLKMSTWKKTKWSKDGKFKHTRITEGAY